MTTPTTTLSQSNLFKPLQLNKDIKLNHRAIFGPVTRMRAGHDHVLSQDTSYTESQKWKDFIADPDNKTGDKVRGLVEEYYHQRSQRPGTLVISEGTFPYAGAGGYSFAPGIYNDDQVESLKKVIDAVHANGSYFIVQFWNLGRTADPEVLLKEGLKYVGPSVNYISGGDMFDTKNKSHASGNLLHALTLEEIDQIKKDYITAAENAFKAGADGVEVHAAGGYLLNQFFDKVVNDRTDQYGNQSFENRARLYFEILDDVIAKFGADRVGTKLSAYTDINELSQFKDIDDTTAFYKYIATELEKRRLEGKGPVYLSLQEPRIDESFCDVLDTDKGKVSNDFFVEIFKGVIIKAGNFSHDFQSAQKAVDEEDRILLAYGRHFIANPDLIDRLENGWELNKYDRNTFYSGGVNGYVDYPYYKKN